MTYEEKKQVDELLDMYGPEELHEDLKPYIEKSKHFESLRHPLVYQVPYFPTSNKLSNKSYLYKMSETKRIEALNDIGLHEASRYIFLHERPYRFPALAEIANKVSDDDFWALLGEVWTDTENLWQNHRIVHRLLSSPRKHRTKMMDEGELRLLHSLPDEFVVFRGHNGHNRIGYSWSLSYGKARWFAQRFPKSSSGVVRGRVRRQHVSAVFMGRHEFEVAVMPDEVYDIKPVVKLKRPPYIESVFHASVAGMKLGGKASDHGPWHWDKVERNAIALCKLVKGADPLVCRLFALVHDSQRENEYEDPEHGERAAEHARKTISLEVVTPEQLDKLCTACADHEKGMVSTDPTIGVCWDADRLDLSRVGITPDPTLLSTEAARGLIWKV